MSRGVNKKVLFDIERKVLMLLFKSNSLKEDIQIIENDTLNLFGSSSKVIESIKSFKNIITVKNAREFHVFKLEFISKLHSFQLNNSFSDLNGVMSEMESLLIDIKQDKLKRQKTKDVFVVHGHNERMINETAVFLKELGLNPIILYEQPNRNRTIIKKFSDYANVVNFAIILSSADDLAYKKTDSSKKTMFRARQNVIFE